MTHKQYYDAVAEIANYSDRDAYISDLSLSSMWGEDANPLLVAGDVASIWDAWHMSIKELRAVTGLSQVAFGRRFLVPVRSIVNWETPGTNHRDCPPYVRMLIADALGLLPERTED